MAFITPAFPKFASIFSILHFFLKNRRRAADYEKKTKIQMSSTGNAGVYVDPTTTLAEGDKEKPAESPEHERLNKEED